MPKVILFITFIGIFAQQSIGQAKTLDVQIKGVDKTLLANVKAYLTLEKEKKHPHLSSKRLGYLFKKSEAEIKQALQPFGYYHSQIDGQLTIEKWKVIFTIQKGAPTRLAKVEVKITGEGAKQTQIQQFIQKFPLKKGQVLNHSAYANAKKRLLSLAKKYGYFAAKLSRHDLHVSLKQQQAEVFITLDSGQRYRFAPIDFKTDKFSPEFLRRFLPFEAGEFYSDALLNELRKNLSDSEYFQEVNLYVYPDDKTQLLHTEANLVLHKRQKYQFLLGYGTDSQTRAGLDGKVRYLNRHGHYLNTELRFKQYLNQRELTIEYAIPKGQDTDNLLFLRWHYDIFDREPFDFGFGGNGELTQNTDSAFSLHKRHRRYIGDIKLIEELAVHYYVSSYDILSNLSPFMQELVTEITPEYLPVLKANYRLLIPEVAWTFFKENNRIYPTRGKKLRFGLRGTKSGFISNLSFWQAELQGKLIRPIGKKSRLITRSQLVYTHAKRIGDVGALVLPLKFYQLTGGDNSVRGYKFEGLEGESGWGDQHLFTASAEYEYQFKDKWSVAAFYDVGNVFASYTDMQLKHTVGVGLHWLSPIGMVRFDLGFPLNDNAQVFRLHLNIGPDF